MTDDRNDPSGPPPEPPAPPPMAAAPPPIAAAPPAPAYQAPPSAPAAPYAVPATKPVPWAWIIAGILGAAMLVFAVLYFTKDRSPRSSADSGFSSGYRAPGQPSYGTPSAPGGMVSATWLQGSWGPRCPGSRNEAVTFSSDGRFYAGGGSGSYTLSGNMVTLNNATNGSTLQMRWDYVSESSARVTLIGRGAPDYVYRCP